MSTEQPVSAVVVTFHPRTEYLHSFVKIRAQVDHLVVVDNGSAEDRLRELRLASRESNFQLIENGRNLGIAAALNRGIREAQHEGCHWVALFDQDSVVTNGLIESLIADFKEFQKDKKIMQIVPRYFDPETGIERPVSVFQDGGIFLTCTSGSLFSMEAFEMCGLFREELFIYCIDDDYSLRIRKKGFFIGESRNAVLLHRSGHPTSRQVFGRVISTKNYRPEVRYYYARNKVWILRSYALTFPRLIVPTLREFVTIPIKIAFMEKNSWKKITLFVRGLVDGIAGRMGQQNVGA
jgi:rhamnosyltransferase